MQVCLYLLSDTTSSALKTTTTVDDDVAERKADLARCIRCGRVPRKPAAEVKPFDDAEYRARIHEIAAVEQAHRAEADRLAQERKATWRLVLEYQGDAELKGSHQAKHKELSELEAKSLAAAKETWATRMAVYAERKAARKRHVASSIVGLPEGASRCARCAKRHRRQMRAANRSARSEARAKGLCAYCRKVKSETYSCAGCVIKRDRVPKKWKEKQNWAVEGADPWRADNDGWSRFRGRGKRGAPPAQATDDSDLASALDAFEKGRAALLYARSPEVQVLGRIQKRSAMIEATSWLELAARFIDDVTDRCKPKG